MASFWVLQYHGDEIRYTQNLDLPSLLPHGDLGFLNRAQNFWEIMLNTLSISIESLFWDDYIQHLPAKHANTMSTQGLIRAVDLHLVNVNFFLTPARLLAPDTKILGGIHLSTHLKLDKVLYRSINHLYL